MGGDWENYEKLILTTLEHHEKALKNMQEELKEVYKEVALLKFKTYLIGTGILIVSSLVGSLLSGVFT